MKAVYFFDYQFEHPIKWKEFHPNNRNFRNVSETYFTVSRMIAPLKRGVESKYYLRDEDEIRRELMG